MEHEGLIERARELEGELADALSPLAGHRVVSEVRAGCGVLAAVQLDPQLLGLDPSLPGRVVAACRRAGVMTRMLAPGAIHISPPLMLDPEGVKELAEGIGSALEDLEAESVSVEA
jgi:putrescine aminotransferase